MKRFVTPVLALLVLGGPVFAQDDWRIERENADLRARLKILEAKLEALERVVRHQEVEMAELRRARRGDEPRREKGEARRPGRIKAPLTREQLREHWEYARERHGNDHQVVRDLGGLLEVLGKDMRANWLRKKHKEAAGRLGKKHPEVREMAELLELLQDDVHGGKLEKAIARWRRIREQLERLDRAAGEKKDGRQGRRDGEHRREHRGDREHRAEGDRIAKLLANAAVLRRRYEEAKEKHGAEHPQTRELVNAFERTFVDLKQAMLADGERRMAKNYRKAEQQLNEARKRISKSDKPDLAEREFKQYQKQVRRELEERQRKTKRQIERALEEVLGKSKKPDRDRPRRHDREERHDEERRSGGKLY